MDTWMLQQRNVTKPPPYATQEEWYVYIRAFVRRCNLIFPVLSDKMASKINAEASPRKPATRVPSKRGHDAEFDLSYTEQLDPSYSEDSNPFNTGEFDQEDTTLVDDYIPIDPRLPNTGEDIIEIISGSKSIEMTEDMENDVFVRALFWDNRRCHYCVPGEQP
jgi:hypothetical protein